MALPVASGNSISMLQIATEFGGTRPYSLSQYYRSGGLVPASNPAVPTSGEISMGSFYGAQAGPSRPQVALNIFAPTTNYDVYTNTIASPNYVYGSTDITVTIASGVVVGSVGVSQPLSLQVPSNLNSPGDTVTINNSGYIWGYGGAGGAGSPGVGTIGQPGGVAIYVQRPTTIINQPSGNIAGGGGGGGGGSGYTFPLGKGSGSVQGGGGGGGGGNAVGTGGPGSTTGQPGVGIPTGAGGAFGQAGSGPSGFAGPGGPGGSVGNAGSPSGLQFQPPGYVPGGPVVGGAAGYAISALNPVNPLTPYVTLINNGQILGPQI